MQDIVFYAAANETLGIVRDYANARNQAAPVLVLGVSVCLRIRLFTACEVATPYPVSAFSGIVDWQWNMDADFDRSTTCKLSADAEAISVHTVTDTVNGETMDFTEFVIPISNMNTQELASWLGNEKKRTGLNGELVGYDSTGNAAFVLQIENFTVRNRVAGLGDPTALDQGIVTRPIAERMIQSAVSSAAGTKQDKLTAANAGIGISIDSGGTISTAAVPQSAVTGLSDSLAAKQDNLTAGYRMAIVSGSTVDQSRWFPVEFPTGSTVTLMAGHAYKLNATTSSKTLNAEAVPANSFGLEGHLEIFVAGSGFVKTGANVVLADALEPDSVNNCTVRFHDGVAIVSVEDHVAGYIVVSATGSTAGTLPYALSTASQEYIAFDATLKGQTIGMGGAVTNGEKHIVGNGYTDTILTGGVSCTSKTTFANLSMQNVVNSGGTMTFGDVYIPQGATVAVSGGGLAVEKVSGNGGVINLGKTGFVVSRGAVASASGIAMTGGLATNSTDRAPLVCEYYEAKVSFNNCEITGNTGYNGGFAFVRSATIEATSCVITGNSATNHGGGIAVYDSGTLKLSSCVCSGNAGDCDLFVYGGKEVSVFGGTIGSIVAGESTGGIIPVINIAGGISIGRIAARSNETAIVTISSGAIVDLTGNTNATPINPGGGVTFASGGATVYPSAGSASAYILGGMTVPRLGNTNVVNLSSTNVIIPSGGTAYASGCTFSGGYVSGAAVSTGAGGAFYGSGSNTALILKSCTLTGNTANKQGNAIALNYGASAELESCIISGNAGAANGLFAQGAVVLLSGCTVNDNAYLSDSSGKIILAGTNVINKITGINSPTVTISAGALITLTSSIAPGGGIVMPARPESAPVQIHYNDPDAPVQEGYSTREFNELEIRGTTISNLGVILGATVTIPADTPSTWLINTTEGTVELTSASAGDYVVSGGLTGVEKS